MQALYPPSLADASVADFLAGLADHDDAIDARRREAEANGCVLRYVAEVTRDSCTVGLASVPQDSPIGRLKGTDNILNVSQSFASVCACVCMRVCACACVYFCLSLSLSVCLCRLVGRSVA